jgi:translation initiation factor IF-1
MASDDLIEVDGEIVDVCAAGQFRVRLTNGKEVLVHLAGRLRRNNIRVVLGDRVTVGLTPYDLNRGRITYRHK